MTITNINSCILSLFPNKPWYLRVCRTSLLKTLWEKEKLLVTSNFSFSHSVSYPFGELCVIFIKFKIIVNKPFQFGGSKIRRLGKGQSALKQIMVGWSVHSIRRDWMLGKSNSGTVALPKLI